MTTSDKAREDRARRALGQQGYKLVKSRRRDPQVPDFGKYMIISDGIVVTAAPQHTPGALTR